MKRRYAEEKKMRYKEQREANIHKVGATKSDSVRVRIPFYSTFQFQWCEAGRQESSMMAGHDNGALLLPELSDRAGCRNAKVAK